MKERIAFVVQRYGLEVNGGAEYHCRLIAELLSDQYEVEVLTTKALDYMTWEDHYRSDVEVINGITVRRFSSTPRNVREFNDYSSYIFHDANHTLYEELEWMRKQGPYSNELLNFIKENQDRYKVFIFFTYNYFTTYFGIQLVPEKSILIPTAHDEPPIYLSMYKPFFHLPRAILYNTAEEREFVHQQFHNEYISSEIVGVGVNIPEQYLSEEQFRNRFKIHDPFILYIGRIDESKGCKELFDHYLRYKKEVGHAPKLVLMGKPVMQIPKDKDIVSLGFVEEEEKFGGISAAQCLIVPSKYESLSMVTLESLALKVPVLVNGECSVLKGHCENGNAGLYYTNYEEFKILFNIITKENNLNRQLGLNGFKYVRENYDWNRINNIYNSIIVRIHSGGN